MQPYMIRIHVKHEVQYLAMSCKEDNGYFFFRNRTFFSIELVNVHVLKMKHTSLKLLFL
jgi:hypothetical protein